MAARKYDSSKNKVGRPRKDRDIRNLVIAMTLANMSLGDQFSDSEGIAVPPRFGLQIEPSRQMA